MALTGAVLDVFNMAILADSLPLANANFFSDEDDMLDVTDR